METMRVVSDRHRDASTAADLACYSVIRAILRAQEADDDLHAARPDIERAVRELIDHFGPGVRASDPRHAGRAPTRSSDTVLAPAVDELGLTSRARLVRLLAGTEGSAPRDFNPHASD